VTTAAAAQITPVSDIQMLEWQKVPATLIVGVLLDGPKLVPAKVNCVPPVSARLGALTVDNTGASKEKMSTAVPMTEDAKS
jgi:hypothetical protein